MSGLASGLAGIVATVLNGLGAMAAALTALTATAVAASLVWTAVRHLTRAPKRPHEPGERK